MQTINITHLSLSNHSPFQDNLFGEITSVPAASDTPKLIDSFIPIFFAFVLIEAYFAPHRYDLADSIMSLVASLLHEVWVTAVKHLLILIPCKCFYLFICLIIFLFNMFSPPKNIGFEYDLFFFFKKKIKMPLFLKNIDLQI